MGGLKIQIQIKLHLNWKNWWPSACKKQQADLYYPHFFASASKTGPGWLWTVYVASTS